MSVRSVTYMRRVAWSDVDASGAWRFTAPFDYVEDAETQLMRDLGVLHETALHLPRIYVDASFKSPARFDDEVSVTLQVAGLGRSSIHFVFSITNGDRLAVEGKLGVAFVGASGRAEELPEFLRAALETGRPAA
jgi:acyl-CoA thioester hydrolase